MATARRFVIHFHCSFPWCAARVALWKSNCPFFMLGCSVPLACSDFHPRSFSRSVWGRVGGKPWQKSPAPFHCHSWLSPAPSASFVPGAAESWANEKTARDWQWSNRDYVFFILFQYLASAVLWRHHSIDMILCKTLTIDVFDISSGIKQHLFLLPSLVQARNIYLGQFEKQSYHYPSLLQCFEASLCFSLWARPAFIPIYLSNYMWISKLSNSTTQPPFFAPAS